MDNQDIGRSVPDGLLPSVEPVPVSPLRAAIPSAVVDALLSVVDAVRDYLPPDGISQSDCLSRIIEATDNPTINPVIRELENGHQ